MSAGTFAMARGAAWLERLDPRLKLCWLACVSILAVVLDAVGALAALALVSATMASGLRMPARAWRLLALVLAAIVWGALLSQGLFYAAEPRTPLLTLIPPFDLGNWQVGGLRLYREGVTYGLAQSLRMVAVTIAGLTVCLSTSPPRLLAALTWLRVPTAIGFMTVAAMRFVPLVLSEYQIVRQARWLRGTRSRGGNWSWRPRRLAKVIQTESALLMPVIAAALRRATSLATSVAARGFDPTARRKPYPPLKMSLVEIGLTATLLSATGAVLMAKLLYWLYLAELYFRTGLRPLYDFARTWL